MDAKRRRAITIAVLFGALGLAAGWFGHGWRDAHLQGGELLRVADAAREATAGFEIELLARTPEVPHKSTVCLLDGDYGMIEKDGRVFNRNSHVDFHNYTPGSFTAGIQGGEDGQVIDLGDVADLEREFGGPPLEVLRWHEGAITAKGEDYEVPDPVKHPGRRVRKGNWFETALTAPAIVAQRAKDKSAQVKPGHVYFVRIADRHDGTQIVALLYVLEYDVGKRVLVRCVQL